MAAERLNRANEWLQRNKLHKKVPSEIRIIIINGVRKNLTPFVFINPTTKAPYSKNINKIWNKACDAAGVDRIELYKATRHSFACQMLNAGMDKGMVSRLLRHSDPKMVERYGAYELETLGRAVDNVRRLPVEKRAESQ
jgi:integrase